MSTLLKIFSLRDLKAGSYGQPFALANRAVAMRNLQDWSRNPESFIARYPSDFELYEVGEFDPATGTLLPNNMPDYVGRASDLVASAS